MRTAAAVLGAVLVAALWANIVTILVIPRGGIGVIKRIDKWVDHMYTAGGRFVRDWERRDALLASQPVVVLALLLCCWLAGFVLGFGLIGWQAGGTFPAALREAGSSLFTLGFAARSGTGPSVVDFISAASGLVVVALQIAYLPTLYAAYNRRETEVTLLRSRAGLPAWGPEILARASLGASIELLPTLYSTWERWSADVAESHASYPSLLRFRSPDPYGSWVVAQLAVMDAAALHLAACPSTAPITARLCLQMGFTSQRQLSRTMRLPYPEDPRPDDPIQLTYEDFLEGWDRLLERAFPVERSPEEAWPHFRGWRVNYEQTAYRLAYSLSAVPARWSGPRRGNPALVEPRVFVNRTPERPDGAPITGRSAATGPGL